MPPPAVESPAPPDEKTPPSMPSDTIGKTSSTPQDAGRKGPDTPIHDDAEDILAAVPAVEVDLESGDGAELQRKPSAIVPRAKRRGLFAYLVVGMPEIEDPVQYSAQTKNFIVLIIALAAVAAPMGYVYPHCLS
jgi:hypothetical protein